MVAWIKRQTKVKLLNLRQILANGWLKPGESFDWPTVANILSKKGVDAVVESGESWVFKAGDNDGDDVRKVKEEIQKVNKNFKRKKGEGSEAKEEQNLTTKLSPTKFHQLPS